MSVNHISQNHLWYNNPQSLDSSNSNSLIYPHHFHHFNLNHCKNDDVEKHQINASVDRQPHQKLESLFEKPLTPSDVGKLNRLVIPKQHAERHFPLNTSNGGDSSGMMLSFEDEDGKFWKFRYSYWNSSQSYVLTKGWSRYVKEKQLESGDIVVFERHPFDTDRLFIGWRRLHNPANVGAMEASTSAVGGVRAAHHQAAGVNNENRTASFNGSTSSRTLRLFGVNMEYQFESDQMEPVTPDGSSTSSPNGQQQLAGYQHYNQQFYPQAYYGLSDLMVQQDGSHSQHRG